MASWVRDDEGHLHWVYDAGTSHNMQDQVLTVTSGTKILIGGNEFTAIKSTTLTKEATIGKRRLEDQSEIADHVVSNPIVIDYTIELIDVDSEYEILDDLYEKKTPFTLVTHRGALSNMVMQKLSDVKGPDTSGSTTANITVQQIRVGKSETVKMSSTLQNKLGATTADTTYPGSNTLQFTIRNDVQFIPAKSAEQSAKEYTDTIIPSAAANQVQGLIATMNTRRSKV